MEKFKYLIQTELRVINFLLMQICNSSRAKQLQPILAESRMNFSNREQDVSKFPLSNIIICFSMEISGHVRQNQNSIWAWMKVHLLLIILLTIQKMCLDRAFGICNCSLNLHSTAKNTLCLENAADTLTQVLVDSGRIIFIQVTEEAVMLILKNEIYLHFFMHKKREVLATSMSTTRSYVLKAVKVH